MHPDLLTIPLINWPIKSYGAMLTIGFLSAVWLCMKRADRLKLNPDVVLNASFVCLLSGVAGGRLFYVIHYWESSFATQANPLFAALNCTSGGLEYYGGFLSGVVGAFVYLLIKRQPVRTYMDILATGTAWGLAFGRIGCLLNGCCWGGLCVDAAGHATVPWGIRFPFGSPAQMRQWENRQTTIPMELIVSVPNRPEPFLLNRQALEMSVEQREAPFAAARRIEAELAVAAEQGADEAKIASLKKQLDSASKRQEMRRRQLYGLSRVTQLPSRDDPGRTLMPSEVHKLARAHGSELVHPAQVYAVISALLLSWLLTEMLYRRKRHGVVAVALLLLYPVIRVILEVVRVDNPHDSAGLTISQAVSVGTFAVALVLLFLVRQLPVRSPLAVPYVSPYAAEHDDNDTPSKTTTQ